MRMPAWYALSVAAHVGLTSPLWFRPPHEPRPQDGRVLAGESFELEHSPDPQGSTSTEAPAPAGAHGEAISSTAERSAAEAQADSSGHQHASRHAASKAKPKSSPPSTASTTTSAAGDFGAVGERGAVDLVSTFTRQWPQIASVDPEWARVPLGSAGAVEIEFTVDDGGKLTSSVGTGSATLQRSIQRTVAFLAGRVFTAHARVTRLRVSARVSADQVHDGLHGDVFAIGGSFTGETGHAFFALAIGRRIDVAVQLR